MAQYDRAMKVAISLPDALLEHFDSVAARSGLNRSEFFRAAGARYAAELEGSEVAHAIDAYLDSRDTQLIEAEADLARDVTQRSRAQLATVTEDDEW